MSVWIAKSQMMSLPQRTGEATSAIARNAINATLVTP